MAAEIVWTQTAISDLEAIAAYIGRDSPNYAAAMVERIVAKVERLARFPDSGRVVPEYDCEDLRELIVQPYRVVYQTDGPRILIVTVVHGARLLE